MNRADLKQLLIDAMDRIAQKLPMVPPRQFPSRLKAMVLAFAFQESLAGPYVTELAQTHKNYFGMKARPGDEGRYETVTYPGNRFDKADGLTEIQYRVYPTPEACISNFLQAMYGSAFRDEAMREFVGQAAATWCSNDPDYESSILKNYARFLGEIAKGD